MLTTRPPVPEASMLTTRPPVPEAGMLTTRPQKPLTMGLKFICA
jgi:hypothetical protein